MASTKDIAILERKLKTATSNREKGVLRREIADLKSKLTTTQKQESLPTQRRKIRMLSSAEFNELIARLKQKPEYSFLKSMGKKKIEDDYRVVGKPVGWRVKGKGNYKVPSARFRKENPSLVYYEDRTNRSDVHRPNRLEHGGNLYKVKDGENVWYLTYLDSTHFFLSNSEDFKGNPYHIGQFRDRPFYNEVNEWLKSETRKKNSLQTGGEMAKGGGVAKGVKVEKQQKFDMVVVSKAAPKDGGEQFQNRYTIYARNINEAREKALKQWKDSFGKMSDLSVVRVVQKNTSGSSKMARGGSLKKRGVDRSLQKKVDEVNRLIQLANENDIYVVDSSTTWEAPMKYKPIVIIGGGLKIEYLELDLYKYKRTGVANWEKKIDRITKANMYFDNPINDIAKWHRKALRENAIQYEDGGMMAKSGSMDIDDKNFRKGKTIYNVIWDDKKNVQRKDFLDKEEAKAFYNKIISEPSTLIAQFSADTFSEYGHLTDHRSLGMYPKMAKGGSINSALKKAKKKVAEMSDKQVVDELSTIYYYELLSMDLDEKDLYADMNESRKMLVDIYVDESLPNPEPFAEGGSLKKKTNSLGESEMSFSERISGYKLDAIRQTDWDKELKEFAGSDYNKMTPEEKNQVIAQMQADLSGSMSFLQDGGNIKDEKREEAFEDAKVLSKSPRTIIYVMKRVDGNYDNAYADDFIAEYDYGRGNTKVVAMFFDGKQILQDGGKINSGERDGYNHDLKIGLYENKNPQNPYEEGYYLSVSNPKANSQMVKLKTGGTTKKEYVSKKVGKVMHEFKEGSLYSGSGEKVTKRDQAIAIGLSEANKGWQHKGKKKYADGGKTLNHF